MEPARSHSAVVGVITVLAIALALFLTLRVRELPVLDVGSIQAPADASRVTQKLLPGGVTGTADQLLRDRMLLDSLEYGPTRLRTGDAPGTPDR